MTDYADAMTRWAAGFVLAATALIAIVININAGLMQDFGGDGTIVSAGYLLAALGVIAIACEIASPVFIRKSWIAGTIILALSIAITGLNELGFYSQARSAHAEKLATIASTRQRLETEVAELAKRLWAVRRKPAGELRAEMDEILAKRVKTRRGYTTIAKATRDCAPRSYLTSRYCGKVFALKKALAAANNITGLERRRDRAQAALNGLKAAGHANALSATLAGILAPLWEIKAADIENFVRLMFVVSVHGLLLASSSLLFGPAPRTIAANCPNEPSAASGSDDQNDVNIIPWRGRQDGRAIAEGFLRTRLHSQAGGKVDFSVIYAAYGAECGRYGEKPLSANSLGIMLTALDRHSGKTRGGPNGGARYHGIQLCAEITENVVRSIAA